MLQKEKIYCYLLIIKKSLITLLNLIKIYKIIIKIKKIPFKN